MTKKIETKKTTSNKISKAAMVAAASLGVGLTVLPQVANITHLTDKTENVASASRVSTLKVGQMSVDLLDADGYVYDAGTPVYQSFSGDWCVGLVLIEMPVANEISQKIVKVPAQYVTGITSQSFTVNQKLVLGEDNLIGMSNITGPVVNTTPEADKSALNSAIQNAQAKVSIASEYTADSIAKLKTELSKAQAVANDKTATQSQVDTSVSSLQQAINALKNAPKTVDKTALQAIVNQSTDAYNNPQKYTTDSWTPFKSAYEGAVSVLNNASATDLQVDDARFLLNNKFNALVEQSTPSVNKDALTSIIATAGGYIQDEGKYTSETIEALKTAVSQGQSVLSNTNSTQADVDNAVSSIQNAIDGLTVKAPEVNKSDLSNTIKQAEDKINSGKLTTDSQSKLKSQVDEAKMVLNNTSATQTDVDQATSKLKAAISSVVERGDVTKLQSVINTAKEAIASGKYTDESVTALVSAVEKAETVVKDGNATQSVVDAAVTQLQSSIDGLVEIPAVPDVDRSELTSVIKDAEDKINSGEYTDDSVSELQKVLDDAIKVRDNKDATQDDVDNAAKNVKDAVGSLVTKPVDFSSLKKAIDDATKLASKPSPQPANYDASTYPYGQCTWFVYNRALELGVKYGKYMGNGGDWQLAAGYTVTQTPTLHSAVSFKPGEAGSDPLYGHVAFVEQVKSDGSILVSESNVKGADVVSYRTFSKSEASTFHYVIGKYTQSSVDKLSDAIKDATKVLNDENATQSEVDKATKTLQDASKPTDNGNTEKPGDNGGNTTKPDTGGNNNSGNASKPGGNTAKPGDTGNVAKPDTAKPTKTTTGGTSQSTTTTQGTTAAQATPAAPAPTYIVQDGDTLTAIAQKLGTSADYLVAANGVQNPDLIFVGDVLKVGEATPATPATTATSETEATTSDKAETTKVATDTTKSKEASAKTSSKDKATSETKQEVKATDDKTADDDVKTDSKTEKSNGNGVIAVILGALAGIGGFTYFSRKKK